MVIIDYLDAGGFSYAIFLRNCFLSNPAVEYVTYFTIYEFICFSDRVPMYLSLR